MAINWQTYQPPGYTLSPVSADRSVIMPKGRSDFDFITAQFDPTAEDYLAAEVGPLTFMEQVYNAAHGLAEHVQGRNPSGSFPANSQLRNRIYDLAVGARNLAAQVRDPRRDVNKLSVSQKRQMMKNAVQNLWRSFLLLSAYSIENASYWPPFSSTKQLNFAGGTSFGSQGGTTPPPAQPQPSPEPGFGFSAPDGSGVPMPPSTDAGLSWSQTAAPGAAEGAGVSWGAQEPPGLGADGGDEDDADEFDEGEDGPPEGLGEELDEKAPLSSQGAFTIGALVLAAGILIATVRAKK